MWSILIYLSALTISISAAPTARDLLGLIDSRKLTFDSNGHFKVVSLSDMHFGERWGNGSWASWGPQNDAKTQTAHAAILDEEKPNYVVFNGDLMTGENVFVDNATVYLDQVFAPTVARNIPFSCTHGNHDNANNINHQQAIEYEQKKYGRTLSHTRSDVGPKPYGNGNYWVPVYAKKWDWSPAVIMWFFDSRSFVSGTGNGPGPIPAAADKYWVDEKSVPFYIKTQSLLMKAIWGHLPPSLVFVHIPFELSSQIADLPSIGNHDDDPNPGTQGEYNNTYTALDLPTFKEIVGLSEGKNKVLAVTSGHDHGDSWCARSSETSGVPLCFNGHSGYGGYTTANSKIRNGRVFDLQLSSLSDKYPSVQTWNSYENSTTNDHVILGKDFMKAFN